MKRILTIQDISCVGKCSLTVALPIISMMNIETCILPSAVLSTHTGGFTGFTFRDLTNDLPPIAHHWQKEGIDFSGIYTGYVGSTVQLEYIKDIFKQFKTENSIYFVDPVMADHGRLYQGFDMDYVAAMREFCGAADVIAPNITEACFLVEEEYQSQGYSKEYIEGILRKLSQLGPQKIVLTGVSFSNDQLGIATLDAKTNNITYYFNEKINKNFHGTGDVFASTCFAAMIEGYSLSEASAIAADFTVSAMKASLADENAVAYGVNFETVLPQLSKFRKE